MHKTGYTAANIPLGPDASDAEVAAHVKGFAIFTFERSLGILD